MKKGLPDLPKFWGAVPPLAPTSSDNPVSVPTVLNDPAKVEGVQSFPHLEAQHGAAKTWPPISTCLDIIFQRRSGLGLYACLDNRTNRMPTPLA